MAYDNTLTNLCLYLRNWFYTLKSVHGKIKIVNGNIDNQPFLDEIQTDQYFQIEGSTFNDGVHLYDGKDLKLHDEEFVGVIRFMAVPKAVLNLSKDIETWTAKNAEAIDSPYQSESFGGYSYSKGNGGTSGGGVSWQSQFASRLNMWRKI
jgi:hypothetical protein